jgi:hypothetical protein
MKKLLLATTFFAISTGAFAGETLKIKATIKATAWVTQPVADVEGHNLILTKFTGSATLPDGSEATVDFSTLADTHNGAGPLNPLYYGITMPDGSQLWLKAVLMAHPDGPNHSKFDGSLTVIGGKGKYANAQGDGTFLAERTTAPGVGAQATNDITINLTSGSDLGTADEAKAMLIKTVAAIKADRDLTVAQIQRGENGFRDRDLYPFCNRLSDGKTLVGATTIPAGTDSRTLEHLTERLNR